MITPPIPADEAQRLEALRAFRVLDTEPDEGFDDLTFLASQTFGVPISLVSLVDDCRQWFKSRCGIDATETSRDLAFCAHAILSPAEVLVVPDATKDVRFAQNSLVTGEPHIRFYAGAPLVTKEGFALGTLCVIDRKPREFDARSQEMLKALSRQVVSQLELRSACTDLSATVHQFNRANQDLQDFAYVAAHDLQEPLRKLVSFSDLLVEDAGPELPERAREDLGFITDAAQRMHQLIGDLLRLSRVGTAELATETFNLRACVDTALDAVSLRIEDMGATVEIAPLPDVAGDRTLFAQLFQNLIGNALKFVGDDAPRVEITCEVDGPEVVIGVRDNGIGMDPSHAEMVFVPFKRLHGRGEYPGTGIGLAIARKAVERHDGRVWVESSIGEGSHFRFSLAPPVVTAPPVFTDGEKRGTSACHT